MESSSSAPIDPRYAPLFRPFALGSLSLANRMVMAPMTRNFSPRGVPGENVAAYYAARARHGTGLILTEGVLVPHAAANGYPNVPRLHGDDALAGWKRVADAVHAEGGRIFPQLWHVGSVRRTGMEPDPAVGPVGPSAIAHPYHEGKGETPHALTRAEIRGLVDAYASAAVNARSVGFDGVEVHGAHGYLIDQFFWSVTNQRDDEYGGSLANRTRFACDIVRAIRERTSKDFPIVFRFSQWKMGAYRERFLPTEDQLAEFLGLLVDAGVDVFHPSTRKATVTEFEGSPLTLAGAVKKLSKKPTIAVGSVGLEVDMLRTNAGQTTTVASLDDIVTRLAADEFDLVAIGRSLLADARFPEFVRAGTPEQARVYTKDLEKVLE